MNLGQLIKRLEELKEEHGEDAEVFYVYQPSWPMQEKVKDVGGASTWTEDDEVPADVLRVMEPEEQEQYTKMKAEAKNRIYLSGQHDGYADDAAVRLCGYGR